MWACLKDRLPVAAWMATLTDRVNIHHVSKNGYNAISASCQQGHLEMTKYLHESLGLNPDLPDASGETSLIWASHKGHFPIVKYLASLPAVNPHHVSTVRDVYKSSVCVQELAIFGAGMCVCACVGVNVYLCVCV